MLDLFYNQYLGSLPCLHARLCSHACVLVIISARQMRMRCQEEEAMIGGITALYQGSPPTTLPAQMSVPSMGRITTGATKAQGPGTTAPPLAEPSQCRRLSMVHAVYQSVWTMAGVITTGVTGTSGHVTPGAALPGGITAVLMNAIQGLTRSVLKNVQEMERATTGATELKEGGTIALQLITTKTMTIQVNC